MCANIFFGLPPGLEKPEHKKNGGWEWHLHPLFLGWSRHMNPLFYLFIPFSCENIRFLSPKSIALLCLTYSTGEHINRNVFLIYLATMDNSIWQRRVGRLFYKINCGKSIEWTSLLYTFKQKLRQIVASFHLHTIYPANPTSFRPFYSCQWSKTQHKS